MFYVPSISCMVNIETTVEFVPNAPLKVLSVTRVTAAVIVFFRSSGIVANGGTAVFFLYAWERGPGHSDARKDASSHRKRKKNMYK